jgi:hypothetical protein
MGSPAVFNSRKILKLDRYDLPELRVGAALQERHQVFIVVASHVDPHPAIISDVTHERCVHIPQWV